MKHTDKYNPTQHNINHLHTAFDNPEMFAKKFDSPERDRWQKPDRVIESFHLTDNATIVDIGAGTGYFTVRLARYLKHGKVVALDESPQMVEYLKKRATKLGLTNVDSRLAKVGGKINLQEKVNLIMCVDVYHHIPDRVKYFSNLLKYLSKEGCLVIIDRAIDSPDGPPLNHRISPDTAKMEMEEAGFTAVKEIDFLLPYQWYIVFEPIK